MSVVFAFGPDDSFFMQTPHGRVWNNLPQQLLDHLEGRTDIEAIDVVYWMILGSDKTYRMGWRDSKGVDRMTLPEKANNRRLVKFDDWANNAKYKHLMPHMTCTLGSDDSFWASCSGTQRWHYISKRAEEKLQAGRDPDLSEYPCKVKLVALGYGHSYFIAFEDGTSSWKVKTNYKALEEVFDEEKKKAERVVCLAMNPFKRDQYFMAFNDGTTYWSLPKESSEQVAELAAKLKAKEGDVVQGTTKSPTSTPVHSEPVHPIITRQFYETGFENEPPAYTAGSGKTALTEKDSGKEEMTKKKKKSLKQMFGCQVM